MPQVDALVTPSVMKWAREQAGLDIATAAKKLGRPEDDVIRWEDGTVRPSIAQARKAAEVYKRSLAVFYLPDPPKGFQTLRDFRHLPDKQPAEYSPELALLVRRVQVRQEWLREWREVQGEEKLAFVGSATTSTPPAVIADAIRNTLGVTPDEQFACGGRREALNLWVERAEAVGVSVCRESSVECEEARGFVIADEYAPFIFVNSGDARAAQLFTLLHELAHLWLNLSGISNLEDLDRPRTETDKFEMLCNAVAAEAVLDTKSFLTMWSSAPPHLPLAERIAWVSERTKVSEEVVARRLLERNAISTDKYRELRRQFIERWKQLQEDEGHRNRQKEGGPSPHLLRVLANGRTFTQAVLSAYYSGRIGGSEASSLLHAKINNLPKIAEKAGMLIRSRRTNGGAA